MNKISIIAVLASAVIGIGGFFAGVQYQKNQATTAGQLRRFGQGGGQNTLFRPVRGQILNIDGNTITVKMMDGSSKIVVVSGSTAYLKSTAGVLTDLKTGDSVMVVGSSNSDGSVTAQNVQINPPIMRGSRPTGQ